MFYNSNISDYSSDYLIKNNNLESIYDTKSEIGLSIVESFIYDRNELENILEMFIQNKKDSERRTTNNNYIFKTEKAFLKKKRGRKIVKEKKNQTHTSFSFDNIITKVQIHFMNFFISFLNECVSNFSTDKIIKFFKFAYSLKSNSTNNHIQEIKNYTIRELLERWNISDKYRKYKKDINKRNVEKLVNKNPFFEKLFQKNYLDFFLLYFNDEQPLEELIINGKIIRLSKKTKNFYYLLQKDKDSKEYILKYTKMIYPIKKDSFLNKNYDFIQNKLLDK